MRITLTGVDGSVWNLTSPEGGIFVVRGGVRGLGMPKMNHYRDSSAAVHGAFWRGLSYEPREIFLPVYMYHEGSTREWVEFDQQFWDALHPESEVTITISIPGVGQRTIPARLQSDDDWAPEVDPTFFGWAAYGLRFQADTVFWRGSPISRGWESLTPEEFHGGLEPGAPIVRISRGQSLESSTLTNPGDVETWVRWTATGPATETRIKILGQQIVANVPLTETEALEIETDPLKGQSAYRVSASGARTDVFHLLNDIEFAPLPPKKTTTVELTTEGTGVIGAVFTPLYLRAW